MPRGMVIRLDTALLTTKARYVRQSVLGMCSMARTGHVASSLSCTDILVALYYGPVLRVRPGEPDWPERDRLIVSKGHGGIGLYPILADLGFFPESELSTFSQAGSRLGAHPDTQVPGIETDTGSLGHGLGLGAGLALAAKLDSKDYRTFVLLGDGECYEGSVWEAAMFAAGHHLDNLVAIVDRNGGCVVGRTEDLLPQPPMENKWQGFGWDALVIDGHSFSQLTDVLGRRPGWSDRPLALIANTVKGKGAACLENSPMPHSVIPSCGSLS